MIDLTANHSDDWFSFPVDALAGHVVTLDKVEVVDSFGEVWEVETPYDWSLFDTEGLDSRSMLVWATVGTPLEGPVLDQVDLGIDEDMNLLWAVERRLRGRDISSARSQPGRGQARLDTSKRQRFDYRPATRVPPHWHPYVLDTDGERRRFVQGRAADLSGDTPTLLPPPSSDLLIDPAWATSSDETRPVHQIEPAAIPPDGVQLTRRAFLTRSTDASPVLWTQRRRLPLLAAPALRLRFDFLEPVPHKD